MSKASVEDIKIASAGLRGQLAEQFADTSTPNIPEDSNILLKHHGSYQQDNRDVRAERTKAKLDKAWSFMIRSKMPGGRITASYINLQSTFSALNTGIVVADHVTATGTYAADEQLYVRNRPNNDGVYGYEILVPFRAGDGTAFLVDRGWVKNSEGGASVLPQVPPFDRHDRRSSRATDRRPPDSRAGAGTDRSCAPGSAARRAPARCARPWPADPRPGRPRP